MLIQITMVFDTHIIPLCTTQLFLELQGQNEIQPRTTPVSCTIRQFLDACD